MTLGMKVRLGKISSSAHVHLILLGAVHGRQSYLIILVAISLSALDIFAAVRRIIIFLRSPDRSPRAFWRYIVKKEQLLGTGREYSGIGTDEPEEYNSSKLPRDSVELQHIPLTQSDDHSDNRSNSNHHQTAEQWAHAVHRHHRRHSSAVSEGTLFGMHSPTHSQETLHDLKLGRVLLSPRGYLSRFGQAAFAVVERGLVLAGFAQLLVGIVVYTGKPYLIFYILRAQLYVCRRMPTELCEWVFGTFDQ